MKARSTHLIGRPFISLACLSLLSIAAMAALLDGFDGSTYNAGAQWLDLQVSQGTAADTVTLDQTTNAGKLTITSTNVAGDQTSLILHASETLDVGEYVQAKVTVLSGATRLGLCLAATTTITNRANLIYYGLRNDGITRGHAYGDGGSEIWDAPATSIPGWDFGVEVTFKIVRSAEREYQCWWGLNGNAENFDGSVIWPESGIPPIHVGFMFDPGLADFQGTVDDFETDLAGGGPTPTPTPTPTPEPTPPPPNRTLDDFNDGSFDTAWIFSLPQINGGDGPALTYDESSVAGKLRVDFNADNGGGFAFLLREDAFLEVGEAAYLDARQIEGTVGDLAIWFGMALATRTGEDQRVNVAYYTIRNDGILRGLFFGDGGAEIGGVEPALGSYGIGDVITFVVHRVTETRFDFWYTLDDMPLTRAGSGTWGGGSVPPIFAGLCLGVSENCVIEFDNFQMYKTPVNSVSGWTVIE
ncbi:MAG TPA: hypothetical protein PLD73_15290 [Candidatus Hydrogenedentes bacterium]|nr:hypothetical protein [Candidatus Hydrogenedentota bacterium]